MNAGKVYVLGADFRRIPGRPIPTLVHRHAPWASTATVPIFYGGLVRRPVRLRRRRALAQDGSCRPRAGGRRQPASRPRRVCLVPGLDLRRRAHLRRRRTWDLGWQESRTRSPNVDNGWVSERFGPGWGESPLALAVSPTDPTQAWGTDMGRTLSTMDSGKTWNAAYTRKLADGSWASTGLDVTTTYGIHFDPFDLFHVKQFISYTDIGLWVERQRRQRLAQRDHERRAARMGEHDVLGGVRPQSQRPHVGRDERHARSAAPENVAPQFARDLPRRRCPQRRRRQDLATDDERHAADRRDAHPSRRRKLCT